MARIHDLPDEVVNLTFSILFSYAPIFNPGLYLGHLSAYAQTLRCKNAIVLVCKRWNLLGTPFLYRSVIIRRTGQLKSLLYTLIDTNNADSVKSLAIERTCFAEEADRLVFAKNVRDLIRWCPQLVNLSIQPFFGMEIPDCQNALNKGILSSLTGLELGLTFSSNPESPDRRHLLMEFGDQLLSLSIFFTPADDYTFSQSPLSFTRLSSLQITMHRTILPDHGIDVTANPTGTPNLPLTWDMPNLSSLSLRLEMPPDLCWPTIDPFIREYGHNLHFLGIHAGEWGPGITPPISTLLQHCTLVKHLSFDQQVFPPKLGLLDGVSFPSIKTLDLLTKGRMDTGRIHFQKLCSETFPNIGVIRFFSRFDVENLFTPPVSDPFHNPIHVLEEAFSWQRPHLDHSSRIDFQPLSSSILGKLAIGSTDECQRYVCLYTVRPPSAYHPMADEWGDETDPLYYLGSPTTSEDEESESDTDTDGVEEDSYSDTSYDSDDSVL